MSGRRALTRVNHELTAYASSRRRGTWQHNRLAPHAHHSPANCQQISDLSVARRPDKTWRPIQKIVVWASGSFEVNARWWQVFGLQVRRLRVKGLQVGRRYRAGMVALARQGCRLPHRHELAGCLLRIAAHDFVAFLVHRKPIRRWMVGSSCPLARRPASPHAPCARTPPPQAFYGAGGESFQGRLHGCARRGQ